MPVCPIVEAHLHLWDPRWLRYPLVDAPFLLDDSRKQSAGVDVEAKVFVQRPGATMILDHVGKPAIRDGGPLL